MSLVGASSFAFARDWVSGGKRGVLKATLSLLHYSGLARRLAPSTRGRGAIFTLHSVSPEAPGAFDPNGILRVTPAFLEAAILAARKAGYDIVSLDEAVRRLSRPDDGKPFACFTLDDGYRDNLTYAYPLFKRLEVPFAIYVPTAYADGQGDLWWLVLEAAIRKAVRLDVVIGGQRVAMATETPAQKRAAFSQVYWPLRSLPEREMRAAIQKIAQEAGYDSSRLCRDLIMTWDEIRSLAADPLVTIGAHTVDHLAIAKLPADEARREIAASVERIEAELGRPCRHFSFPYGDASAVGPRDEEIARGLGLATAVTTRKDVIDLQETGGLWNLPRISLNGDYQKARYVEVFLTGAPFRMTRVARQALGALRGRRSAPLGGAQVKAGA